MITREDVTAASARLRPEPLDEGRTELAGARDYAVEAGQAPREDVRIPIKGVRKSMADAMVRSAFTHRMSQSGWTAM